MSGTVAFTHQKKTNCQLLMHYRIFLTLSRNVGKLSGSLRKPALQPLSSSKTDSCQENQVCCWFHVGRVMSKPYHFPLLQILSVSAESQGREPATLCPSLTPWPFLGKFFFYLPQLLFKCLLQWVRYSFGLLSLTSRRYTLLMILYLVFHDLMLAVTGLTSTDLLILASLKDGACLSPILCLVLLPYSIKSTIKQLLLSTSAHSPELQCSTSNWLFVIVSSISSPQSGELGLLSRTFP